MTPPRRKAPAAPPEGLAALASVSLESLFCGKGFAGIPGSLLQRAICRASEGLSFELPDEMRQRHFGCTSFPASMPKVIALVAGIRGGKSFLAAAAGIRAAFRCDLSSTQSHEIVRVPIVGPTLDASDATFKILLGILESSPLLRQCLHGAPTSDTVVLRRPQDGRLVELCCVAASRGGSHLRSRWLAGCILDEAALFGVEATGAAVSAEELFRAGYTRLLPGAQLWVLSSPFGPQGLLYDLWKRHFGRPGQTLVVHAPTRALNPSFPQTTIDQIRADSPDVAAREYDAEWLDAESVLLVAAQVDAATRAAPLERAPMSGYDYACAIDPATRGNAWTLVVITREASPVRTVVVLVRQWIGSKTAPLDPREVFREIAKIVKPYRVDTVNTDRYSADALRAIADNEGLFLRIHHGKQGEDFQRYESLRIALGQTPPEIELPPDPQLRTDLIAIRKRAAGNGVSIFLPTTPDGRHCDYAPALVLANAQSIREPEAFTEESEHARFERCVQEQRERLMTQENGSHWADSMLDD